METIRNYLESMFATLPNTPEVLRAKYELSQMMEDKFAELVSEGRAENEAVGIVISEFGNLDELSEVLGIREILRAQEADTTRTVPLDEVRDFISDSARAGFLRGLGIFFCICCPVGATVAAGINSTLSAAVGTALLFLLIAAGVGLIIYSSISMQRWEHIRKRACRLDYATTAWVSEQRDGYRSTYALYLTIGVILCIVSVIPVSVTGALGAVSDRQMGFASALIFVLVGIGVMLLVANAQRSSAYSTLLRLNSPETVGGTYTPADRHSEVRYDNRTVATVMSVYWPTVTCVYLIWSFLTFAWGITWIIWPVAAIIETLVKNLYGIREQ